MSFSPYGFSKVKYHLQYVPKIAQRYFKLLNWKKNSKIIDIGTGPGHLLFEVEPLFPKDYAEILCTDKLEHMVDHFNSLQKDPRMTGLQMDIQTSNLPEELKSRFDFAFSCNCLMYLSNIRQTFLNTSQLLNQNGELFFIWPKICDVHNCYKAMSKIEKWLPYMSDFKNWNNHFDTENPTETVKTELHSVGMKVLEAELIDIALEDEESKNLIDMFDSLDYISSRIPKYDIHQYKEDYHKIVYSSLIIDPQAENGMRNKLPFASLVVAARKI